MKAPAADRKVLVFIAGAVWSVVGIFLIVIGMAWLLSSDQYVLMMLAAGIIGGAIIYRFGFSKLAGVNLERIFEQAPGKDRICIFAFQNIRSYIIVVVMMVLGYALRHLPIPKIYLAPVYLTIGLGLFLSSLHYYARLASQH